MKQEPQPELTARPYRLMAAASMLLASALVMSPARAADDAAQILKAMADYVVSQKTISLTFDSDVEVITPEVEKIQFAGLRH